jgi:hypothetical protein
MDLALAEARAAPRRPGAGRLCDWRDGEVITRAGDTLANRDRPRIARFWQSATPPVLAQSG